MFFRLFFFITLLIKFSSTSSNFSELIYGDIKTRNFAKIAILNTRNFKTQCERVKNCSPIDFCQKFSEDVRILNAYYNNNRDALYVEAITSNGYHSGSIFDSRFGNSEVHQSIIDLNCTEDSTDLYTKNQEAFDRAYQYIRNAQIYYHYSENAYEKQFIHIYGEYFQTKFCDQTISKSVYHKNSRSNFTKGPFKKPIIHDVVTFERETILNSFHFLHTYEMVQFLQMYVTIDDRKLQLEVDETYKELAKAREYPCENK